ncbi:hypothetical protein GA0115233_103020 [Streptomyces sp. DI166]|uniref:hypothetical protein n=1 Tax=Streptomyces sp. DI166 TaxID=1839783 RepID=UPI0007F3ED81|nr:hypothetical protein [Streptomyces sp. DI166]SBT91388.1 hypothetical protein GA0115233_103020 [Streptomyces sp. DI166]
MAKTLGLPRVTLVPDDLPEPVRETLGSYYAARARAAELGTQLDRTPWNGPKAAELGPKHEAALAEAVAAHQQLSAATVAHGRAISDFASVQFIAHMERIRELLAEAEREARAAAGSASLAVAAAARRGRPVLDPGESGEAQRSDARRAAMSLAGRFRNMGGELPEGV